MVVSGSIGGEGRDRCAAFKSLIILDGNIFLSLAPLSRSRNRPHSLGGVPPISAISVISQRPGR